jgi:subtilase family serine protease
MHSLSYLANPERPARYFSGRRLASGFPSYGRTSSRAASLIATAIGLILLVLTAPNRAFAQAATIELSPLVTKSTMVSPVDRSQQISVVLILPLSDPKGAAEFGQHVSRRGDSLFHQYLTPREFASRYGASGSDYVALKQWAVANGLTVSQESIARTTLTVHGTVAKFQSLFNTQINNYRSPAGDEFYSAGIKPTVPSSIAGKVSAVIGLTGSKMRTPQVKVGKTFGETPNEAAADKTTDYNGTGPGGSYSAADLRTIYSIPAFGNLDSETVVAVFEQGGFFNSDVEKYLNKMNLPHPPVTFVSVDQYDGTVDSTQVELEAVLDIDMVIAINPNVHQVLVYEDGIDPFAVALLDTLTQVADDNKAQVLSISYGQDEGEAGSDAMNAENTALVQLAAEGITVTASSGDQGAYGDGSNYPYNVSDPASQPYVTGVGGTTLFTGPHQLYVSEQVWNDSDLALEASGGGISSYWSFPDFQGEMDPYFITYLGGSLTYRNVPDVAAVADPNTGVAVYSQVNGGWLQVGGTSASSPIWASYLGIVNVGMRYSGLGNIGFFNPILYDVGYWELPFVVRMNTTATTSNSISPDGFGMPGNFLYPVLDGSNGDVTRYPGYPGYSAGGTIFQPLYCNATGNGTITGGLFAAQILISGTQNGTSTGAINSFTVTPGTTTAKFKWSPVSAALAYVVTVGHVGLSFNVIDAYVTKGTSLTVKDLLPHNDSYTATLWAFNASGFSNANLQFNTKK